jgi:hypothetical protein
MPGNVNNASHDRAIAELEVSIGKTREQMEEACRAWLDATVAFLSQAYPSYAEEAVTDRPDVARDKGVEGLAELKSDLRALVERTPDLVEKSLNVDSFWAHRAESIGSSAVSRSRYAPDSQQPPDELYGEVSKVLGQVAPLLVRHGFGSKGSFGPWMQEWGRRGSSHWRLIHRYDWSDEMEAAMKRYAELYGDLHQCFARLEEIRLEKRRAEARDLWEQA